MPLFPHGEGIARGDHGVLGLGVLGLAPHVREDLVQHVEVDCLAVGCCGKESESASRMFASGSTSVKSSTASTSLSKTFSVGTMYQTAESSPTTC